MLSFGLSDWTDASMQSKAKKDILHKKLIFLSQVNLPTEIKTVDIWDSITWS